MLYASNTRVYFKLHTYSNLNAVLSAINDLQPSNDTSYISTTNLGRALINVRTDVLAARGNRNNNPDVVIVFNSGNICYF